MIENVELRCVDFADASILFKWANDCETRLNSFSKDEIKYEDHIRWLKNKIEDSRTIFLIMEAKDKSEPIGSLRLDFRDVNILPKIVTEQNDRNLWASISYQVNPLYRGQGYGCALIDSITHISSLRHESDKYSWLKCDEITFVGEVLKQNVASINCFRNNKYAEIDDDEKIIFYKKILL